MEKKRQYIIVGSITIGAILLTLIYGLPFLRGRMEGMNPKAKFVHVDNVPFEKVRGSQQIPNGRSDDSIKAEWFGGRLYLLGEGNRESALFSTEDGRKYDRLNFDADFFEKVGLPKKWLSDCIMSGMKVENGELVLTGYYDLENEYKCPSFTVRTKNGKEFYGYQEVQEPEILEQYYMGSFHIGKTEIRVGDYWYDNVCRSFKIDKESGRFTEKYYFLISTDGKKWKKKSFSLQGKVEGKKHIYDEDLRKIHCVTDFQEAWCDGTYFYINMAFRDGTHQAEEDEHVAYSEAYVYRTRDFEKFERLPIPGTETDLDSEHREMLVMNKNGSYIGVSEEYKYDGDCYDCDNRYLSKLSISRGKPLKLDFTYKAGEYHYWGDEDDQAKEWKLYQNEQTGGVTLFMIRRNYPDSIFVSENENEPFKGYEGKWNIERMGQCYTDKVNGYQILEVKVDSNEEGWASNDYLTHLYISKDGFVNTYEVDLPKKIRYVRNTEDTLLAIGANEQYYIPLEKLYGLLK